MGAREPKVSRLGRFVRGRRLDRNPLRRSTDRIETMVLAVLAIAFLAGAPLAAAATGGWLHGMAQREQLAQQASLRQVPAAVLAVTPPAANGTQLAWEARARWKAPDGQVVTNEVPVPAGTAVGATIQVWTDRSGDLASAPLVNAQVADQGAFGEVLGVVAAAGVLALAGVLARRALDRRRMAAWDADWQATGPRWTTRA